MGTELVLIALLIAYIYAPMWTTPLIFLLGCAVMYYVEKGRAQYRREQEELRKIRERVETPPAA
jgi:hypothetical protein